MPARIYVANETFWYHGDDDQSHFVQVGTRFQEGDPALNGRLSLFTEDKAEDVRAVPVKRGPGRPPKE